MQEKTISQCNPAVDMRCMRWVLWGIVFYLCDLRILGLNMTADPLGYLFILWGLRGLLPHCPRIKIPMVLSGALAVLTLPDFWKPPLHTVDIFIETTYSSLFQGVLCTLLAIALCYTLCTALLELARQNSHPQLADACRVTRWFYALSRLSIVLMPLVALAAVRDIMVGAVMTAGLVILGFSGDVVLLLLVRKTYHVPRART